MTKKDITLFANGVDLIYLGLGKLRESVGDESPSARAIEEHLFYETILGIKKLKDHLGITNGKQYPS